MSDFLDAFVSGLRKGDGGMITTVAELRENQFGFPLRHYAQQYLYGATGLRIGSFNSIQGMKEQGKSTSLYDLCGYVAGAPEDGGLGGLAVIYELEGKISPTILYSILSIYGERAKKAVLLRLGQTLESALSDLNKRVIPKYLEACPERDRPLLIGFDSIGGAAAGDTVEKLQKGEEVGKGYYNKQHFMKYFCENQGAIFARLKLPVVVMCINQERESASATGYGPPQKVITGGKAQTFKDGHMLSASKRALGSGDGNVVTLRTVKTSFCDPRKVEVEFRWNKFGRKEDDAYEARFNWALASACCLAEPEKGVGGLRDICDVKVSDQRLVTCPQLGLKSVPADEFETALMSNQELLKQLYVFQKIERLKDLHDYAEYLKAEKSATKTPDESTVKPVPRGRGRKQAAQEPADG